MSLFFFGVILSGVELEEARVCECSESESVADRRGISMYGFARLS